MRQLLHLEGPFGDHPEITTAPMVHHEPLQKTTGAYDYQIEEHLHSHLLQIFMIRSGGGLLISEGKKIALTPPCVLFMPNNTLHGFAFQRDISGHVFTISTAWLERSGESDEILPLDLSQIRLYQFGTGSTDLQRILYLGNRLVDELENKKKAHEVMIGHMLQMILILLYRAGIENEVVDTKPQNKMLRHYICFQRLIRQYAHQSKSIQFYAQKMKMTSVHLNRVCKLVAQKSALQVVHEYVMNEAKKYLRRTNYSISEISYFLDFKDPAYFSKFFKQREGITPGRFRSEVPS